MVGGRSNALCSPLSSERPVRKTQASNCQDVEATTRGLVRVGVLREQVFTRAAMPCSRNDNVGGSDNYDRGYDYHFAARDDLHTANYNHTRRLDLHTSRHDNYTSSDDYHRRLDYDASRHHHNATCHHHVDARSVSLPNTRRFYIRSLSVAIGVGVVGRYATTDATDQPTDCSNDRVTIRRIVAFIRTNGRQVITV